MRRNCNLELRLVPSSDPDNHLRRDGQQQQQQSMRTEDSSGSPQEKQQLTIFYNGRVCVSDVTELQARAIIMLASREMEEDRLMRTPTAGSEPASPNLPSPMYSPSSLTMKRSLRRFLQKRKLRSQATSPYNH